MPRDDGYSRKRRAEREGRRGGFSRSRYDFERASGQRRSVSPKRYSARLSAVAYRSMQEHRRSR